MHKKTIVMIGNTSWGMFHFRAETMKEFVKNGHAVIVISPIDDFSGRFKDIGCRHIPFDLDRKGINPFAELSSIKKLIALMLEIKPDIVLNYTIKPILYGTVAAKLTRVNKIISIVTGLGFVFSHDNFTARVAKTLYKLVLGFTDEVWFLNKEDEMIFLDSKLIQKSKSFILPGEGIDLAHYSPSDKNDDQIVFTLISRMLWDKGVGLFAEAAEKLKTKYPHVQFQVLGPIDEGNPEGISLKQLKEWNDKGFIQYLGSTDDIRPVLKQTSCLVHPTYYREGLPRVLLEACSMKIPCITTDTPGCKDVIKNGENGFLIKPKDTEALVSALENFINLPQEQKRKLSESSREFVMKMYSSNVINQIYNSRIGL